MILKWKSLTASQRKHCKNRIYHEKKKKLYLILLFRKVFALNLVDFSKMITITGQSTGHNFYVAVNTREAKERRVKHIC